MATGGAMKSNLNFLKASGYNYSVGWSVQRGGFNASAWKSDKPWKHPNALREMFIEGGRNEEDALTKLCKRVSDLLAEPQADGE